MAKKTKNLGTKIIFFILGMLVMLFLDMFFHFNNSVKTQLDKELNKAGQKVEDVFNK